MRPWLDDPTTIFSGRLERLSYEDVPGAPAHHHFKQSLRIQTSPPLCLEENPVGESPLAMPGMKLVLMLGVILSSSAIHGARPVVILSSLPLSGSFRQSLSHCAHTDFVCRLLHVVQPVRNLWRRTPKLVESLLPSQQLTPIDRFSVTPNLDSIASARSRLFLAAFVSPDRAWKTSSAAGRSGRTMPRRRVEPFSPTTAGRTCI